MKNDIHNERRRTMHQASRNSSPWSWRDHLRLLVWECVRILLFRPSPRPLHRWRAFLLRCFGCKITGRPVICSTALVKMPWHLALGDGACLGDHAEVYNLGHVTLGVRCTIAQQAYLCGGSHDLDDPGLPLVVGDIEIGNDVFIAARVLILPGVSVGTGAVIGAGSVVTKDMPEWMICAGNPCRPIKPRAFNRSV